MNPSRLSWKSISWLSDQIFNANHLIFTGYGISNLIIFRTNRVLHILGEVSAELIVSILSSVING